MGVVTAPWFENKNFEDKNKVKLNSHTKKKKELGMRPIDEREKVLNMHFIERKSAKKICAETGIPLCTVKVWINRYKKEHDISQQVLKDDVAFSESELIKIEKKYKTREKTPEQTMEQRINQLEMEVELLRNFLLEKERTLIKG